MKKLLITLLLAAACTSAPAGEPGVPALPTELSLGLSYQLALEHSTALRTADLEVLMQEGYIKEISASRYPRVELNSSYDLYDDDRQQSFGEGAVPDDTSWSAALEGSLYVFSGGRATERIRSARLQQEAMGSAADAARQNILLAVHQAYFDACLAEESIRVQEEALEVYSEQARLAQNRLEAGVGSRFEVVQAEAAVANARPPIIKAQNARRNAVNQLQRLVSLPYPAGIEADDISLEHPEPHDNETQDLQEALAGAAENRPELQRLSRLLEAELHQLSAIRRERIPLVSVYANYGVQSDQFGGDDVLQGWGAGVRMAWSILDGGAIRGRTDQSRTRYEALLSSQQEMLLDVGSEVRQAYYDYLEAQALLVASDEIIRQSEEALRLARNRFEAGKATQLDVLSSALQLTRAKQDRFSAQAQLSTSAMALRKAAGLSLVGGKAPDQGQNDHPQKTEQPAEVNG